jgi:hypothetical protein
MDGGGGSGGAVTADCSAELSFRARSLASRAARRAVARASASARNLAASAIDSASSSSIVANSQRAGEWSQNSA